MRVIFTLALPLIGTGVLLIGTGVLLSGCGPVLWRVIPHAMPLF